MNVNFKHLCFIIFLFPILIVIISFLWSANLNLVSWCIPNFEGCTSISRVGRYQPVVYFFKPLMFIYAIILVFFWTKFYSLLKYSKADTSKFILLISYLSVFFLILYIIFLGEGKLYKFFRQTGIFIYIFFTIFAQIFFSIKIKKSFYFYNKFSSIIIFYSIFIGITGIILLPLVITKTIDIPNFKNIVSWNFFLLIQLYFLLVYFGFKKIDYDTIQPPPKTL